MMMTSLNHEESWVLLPWLANSRLSQAERARLEEHVRDCTACTQELAVQRLLCRALTAPDRVTYAPGPSFRKLMQRIEGAVPAERSDERRTVRVRGIPAPALSAWRPPGLAFAASFMAALGLAFAAATAYHWSQPLYATYTSTAPAPAAVLHIAFERSLPVGEVEEALRQAGARMVEGPDASGIFGVTPAAVAQPGAPDMRLLAGRLRADARVRWVEPLGAAGAAARGSRPQDP
jgi:Putative zinc-finger